MGCFLDGGLGLELPTTDPFWYAFFMDFELHVGLLVC
jgi:hypothetical protein